MKTRALLMFAIAVSGCGAAEDVDVQLVLPEVSDLRCSTSIPAGLTATLFISGNLAPCNLTIDGGGLASGTCQDIPTGITRYLVLRFAVPGPGPGGVLPLRYAVGQADLTAHHLKDSDSTIPIVFSNDGVNGMYVETDADVAELKDLLYGPKTVLSGAICFARTVIAADAGTTPVAGDCRDLTEVAEIMDLDADTCTNLRELCDGTSPTDSTSASCGT